MSSFVDKATSKISKLSHEQINSIIKSQNEELKLRNTVLDSISDGLFLVEIKTGRIKYCNGYAKVFLPLKNKADKILGKRPQDVINEKGIVDFINDCLDKKKNDFEYMYHFCTSLFGEMDLRILSCVTDECILFSIHDFTIINKIKDEFRRNESLAAMTTMAAQVAHEIKNPLASMSIYVQLLQRKLNLNDCLSKGDAEKALKVLTDEIERLNQIAVDFLFAVKPMKVNFELMDINKVIRDTMDVVSAETNSMNVIIEVSLATSLPKLRIDGSLVEQSLLNLLRNSLQAIGTERKDGKISIHSYMDGDEVKIEVADNGCGMTDEQMSKIFEPYYTTKATGTGLGLTTIFKIMKELEGEISVSSNLNEGSVFTLVFPVPNSERFKLENQS